MITTYGARVMDKPKGMLRAFKINDLVRLDEETGDGRLLRSSGAGVRHLPRTVFGGFFEGEAHGRNVIIGRLDAVEFDPDNNTATGWGWLIDDENGRQAARYIDAKAMTGNSIHMAEIEVTIEWKSDDPNDPDFMEYTVVFEKWSVASTTMLGIPAFKDSQFELEPEVLASLYESDNPLEIDGGFTVTYDLKFDVPQREEITASGEPRPPWEYFHRAEDSKPTPITVGEMDGDGWVPVYGNLARWNVCHDGIDARCVIAPYDPTEYSSFNCSSVLTSRGNVPTGPIFFQGGHPDKPLGHGDVAKAYGGIENAWADVRVTHGVHGPWISGVVRPGVTSASVYAARASRISGHWMGDGRLKAIVSCNVPGYDVPGSKVYTDGNGAVLEVVASFVPDCQTEAPDAPALNTNSYNMNIDPLLTFDFMTPEARSDFARRLVMMNNGTFAQTPVDNTPVVQDVLGKLEAVDDLLLDLELEAEEDADRGLV
ncbi:MAG: hypothetical protein K0R44_27 [Thermomicrobiales bacterium]|jgi:hypothetical protein|nr:hypothetical protein [Thermomicrobiales bacterium]MDF3014802.1 hypothetical protein [Thermomicrobiales bacterium]